MVYSMTGFASAHCEFTQPSGTVVQATITIKTLNSRFFETTCKIPHALAALEQPMTQRCKEALKRGSATIIIYVSNPSLLRAPAAPSMHLVKSYVDALRDIQAACQLPGEVTIANLINMPNLFETSDEPLSTELQTQILTEVDKLIATVVAMRAEEGRALQRDLEGRMQTIAEEVERIAPRAEVIAQERTQRLLQIIATTLAEAPSELRDMHIQSIYNNVHTMETHEEIVRLRAHLAQFHATLNEDQPLKGKKLDFILQELFREINTVTSKLADTASMGSTLTIKTELERAREQVQNIV